MRFAKSIAIDGPVASGKTSVGLILAQQLGYLFLDTGIMYRAATWAVLNKGLDIFDEEAVSKMVADLGIEIEKPSVDDGRVNDILVDGVDITWEVRNQEVVDNVSQVSTYKEVRRVLTEAQRRFGLRGNIVMVGRDIGTVVMPDADLKVFLLASQEERARRRFDEEQARNPDITFEEVLENIKKRDQIDSSRKLAPLVAARDAKKIDTDGKSKDEVIEEIYLLSIMGG